MGNEEALVTAPPERAGDSEGDRSRAGSVPPPSSAPPGPGERWTILRLILWSARYLEEKGVGQARLDAEHLLAHALGVARLQLYLQHERALAAEELAVFKPLLLRRAAREPLQHIVGSTSFRELELVTDARALIPRPETEVLVGVVLAWARGRVPDGAKSLTAADIGTGTGCIALSLALEGPFSRVIACDLSTSALDLARENRQRAGLDAAVELRLGNLLEPLAGERFDALISNPPYVAETEREGLAPEVKDFEPAAALFAGADGLETIRELVEAAPRNLLAEGLLALEVGAGQARAVVDLIDARGSYHTTRTHRDLTGRPRVVTTVFKG